MKRLLEETGVDQPTEFERMLLVSIELDVPREGAANAVVERVERMRVLALRAPDPRRVLRNAALLLAAAFIAVIVLVRVWKRHDDVVAPIAQEPPVPASVSSDEPAMQMPLPPAPTPSAVRSVSRPAPTVSVVRRPAPLAPAPALSTLLQNAARDAGTMGQAFDKGQAASALGHIDLSECNQYDGPTGAGHVVVVFAPAGNAQSVTVDPPYAGTARGGCIAGKFAAAQVPPFQGSPVRVGKSFVIN